MYLLSSMARDLQDDFLNLFFPRLITAVDSLFASGGSQDADAIGHVYTNLFRICKFLVKPMTRNIEFVADTVGGLLFSHHAHIRKFSAEMLSYIFRNANLEDIERGVLVLANNKTQAERIGTGTQAQAIALLLTNTIMSTRDHMHSKAESIFRILFDLCLGPLPPSQGARTANQNALASVVLLLLQALHKMYKSADLSVALRLLSDHAPTVFSSSQGGKANGLGQKPQLKMAWFLKLMNAIFVRVSPQKFGDCVARSYHQVLEGLSSSNSDDVLKMLEESAGECNGLAALEEQTVLNLEGEMDTKKPQALPEFFVFMSECTRILQSTDEESYTTTLAMLTGLLRDWTRSMSLSSVKAFCDILVPVTRRHVSLAEPLAPLAFQVIKVTLEGENLLSNSGSCAGVSGSIDILVRAYNLHVVAGSFVGSEICLEMSLLLLNTAKELVTIEKKVSTTGDSRREIRDAFLPIFYMILRLLQRFNVTEHRFEAGNLLYSHAKGVEPQNEEAVVLQCEAAKTATVSLTKYKKTEKIVRAVFACVGTEVRMPSVLKTLIWVLDLPFLLKDQKEDLCKCLSDASWEQIWLNLSERDKEVRLRTLEFLSKSGCFCFKGELHEDSDLVFEDVLSIFQQTFTLETSRSIANKIKRYALDLEYKKVHKKYMSILGHIFIGHLNEAYSECWEPCVNVLKELLSSHFAETFETIWAHVLQCQYKLMARPLEREAPGAEMAQAAFGLNLEDESDSARKPLLTLIPVKYKLLVSSLKSNKQVWREKADAIVPAFIEFSERVCKSSTGFSAQQSDDILFEWVGIMDSIPNIKSARAGPTLKVTLENLLSKVSANIQVQILKSLKAWKVPVVSSRADILIQACNLKTEKDLLPFQRQHNLEKGLSEEERGVLTPLLLRILFPKMKRKKMRLTSRRSQGTARKTILHFLSCFDASELQLLHELFVHPMLTFGKDHSEWNLSQLVDPGASLRFVKAWDSKHIPLNVQTGFLDAFKDFLKCLGQHMKQYLFPWMGITVCFLNGLCSTGEAMEVQQQDPCIIVSLCLDIVTDVFRTYDDLEFGDMLACVEGSLIVLMRTKLFDNLKVFNSLVLFLQNILTSEVLSVEVRGHPNIEKILNSLFQSIGDVSVQKKRTLLKLVDSILEGSQKSSVAMLEDFYPYLLSEVKKMDFKSGDRSDMISTLNVVQRMSVLFSGSGNIGETLQVLVVALKWFDNKRSVAKNEMLLQSILDAIASLASAFGKAEHEVDEPLWDINLSLLPFANLFLYVRQNDLRFRLCNILDTILSGAYRPFQRRGDPSEKDLNKFSDLCKRLNALSETMIGEIDYDKRLGAYSEIHAIEWPRLKSARSITQKILLYQCVYDLTEVDDFSMQQASSEALKGFISVCKRNATAVDSTLREEIYRLLRGGIHNKKDSVRKEYLHLLSHLFLEFPETYKGMAVLCDEDQEQDFFKNVTHLQVHRRVRAVNRLIKLMSDGSLGRAAIEDVVIPLLMGFICDPKLGTLGGTMSNLVDKSVESLGYACKRVEWSTVKAILNRFLRILKAKGAQSKAVMRAVSSTMRFFEDRDEEENGLEVSIPEKSEDESHQYIYKTLLPYLSLLFYQDRDPPSHLVAVLAQVLKVMPENLARIELPQLIQKLSSKLRADLQSSRVNTREAICAMLDVTGYKYLSYVINSINSTLQNRGVQGYVKGYSVYFVLKNIENKLEHGEIDEHLGAFYEIFEIDIFGDVARDRQERKESEKLFKKTFKEGQRCFSLNAFECLAGLMNIEDSLLSLIDFVETNFNPTKRRVKLTAKLFDCMAQGVMANQSIPYQHLLVVFYGMVEDLNENLASQESEMQSFQKVSSISTPTLLAEKKSEDSGSDILLLELKAEFALTMLWKFIKTSALSQTYSKEQCLQLLDPWTCLLTKALKSRKSSLVILALKCLNRVFMLPLKSNVEWAPALSKEVFVLLRRSAKLSDSSAQECLKLLTTLLKHYAKFSPTHSQLNFLIRLISPDIEKTENQNGIFSFLKAIISRGAVLPSVYDLMEKVSSVVLSSGSDSTRRSAGQVFLMYLLDYPMNDNRRKRHLEFIVKNCDFVHEAGRLSMLELILSVLRKFPADIIQDLGEMFLFPLVLRACNEDSPKCRAVSGEALTTLLSRSREDLKRNAYKLSLGWLGADKMSLKTAGCQLAIFLAKSDSLSSGKDRAEVFTTVTDQLRSALVDETAATLKYFEFSLTLLDLLLEGKGPTIVAALKADLEVLNTTESLLLVPGETVKALSAKVMEGILRKAPKIVYSDLQRFQRLFRAIVDQVQGEISTELRDRIATLAGVLLRTFDVNAIPASDREEEDQIDLPLSQDFASGEEVPALRDYFFALKRILSLASGNTTRGRPATAEQQTAGLGVIASFAEVLTEERLGAYLVSFLIPVYHVSNAKEKAKIEVREASEALVERMDKAVGSERVASAFNRARVFVEKKRKDRKQTKAVLKLVDPEQAARNKVVRNLKRKVSRKRQKDKGVFKKKRHKYNAK